MSCCASVLFTYSSNAEITRKKDAVPSQGRDGVSGMGIMKMIGLVKQSKLDRQENKLSNANRDKKMKARILMHCKEFSLHIFKLL